MFSISTYDTFIRERRSATNFARQQSLQPHTQLGWNISPTKKEFKAHQKKIIKIFEPHEAAAKRVIERYAELLLIL